MSEPTNLLTPHFLTRGQIAACVAADLEENWLVNLGIGMPTLIPSYVPADRDVMFHSENGIIGMGPPPPAGEEEQDLVSAGKGPVTLIPGGAIVDHSDSFAVARGGRLDCAVLGAYQVAANGDLCNWRLPHQASGSVGGAMDIAAGAKRVFVMMTHSTRDGDAKIVADRHGGDRGNAGQAGARSGGAGPDARRGAVGNRRAAGYRQRRHHRGGLITLSRRERVASEREPGEGLGTVKVFLDVI
jgi:3-oxoacid CoA-transferase B subunit